jgi:hypothetical protein
MNGTAYHIALLLPLPELPQASSPTSSVFLGSASALDYPNEMLTGAMVVSVCEGVVCSVRGATSSEIELVDCGRERCRWCVGDVGRGTVEAIRSSSSLWSLGFTTGKLSAATSTRCGKATDDRIRS